MRVAVFADLHGDLAALEAILEDAGRRGAEALFHLGDMGAGPEDAAVWARLAEAGVVGVRGEADPGDPPAWIRVEEGGVALALCHADPREAWRPLDAETLDEDLAEVFAFVDAGVLLVGHTHEPLAREVGDRLLLNPGAAGGGDEARYLLLDTDGGLTALHVRVPVRRAGQPFR